jgi:N-methylhydantoinase A
VTDANLYCGRIDKENFVGALKLDDEAATAVIEELARKVDLSPRRLALGILKLANLSMAAAVRRQTLERGRDPRDFALAAYGGAGPMHACEVATEVGIHRVIVPVYPGHFSAIGMLRANLRLDRREIFRSRLDAIDIDALGRVLERAAAELSSALRFGVSAAAASPVFSYSLALRYHGQDHTLLIPAAESGLTVSAGHFEHAFEEEYLRRYGHLDTESAIEVAEVEIVGERSMPRVEVKSAELSVGPTSRIESYFGLSDESVETPVVPRSSLRAGESFAGPLVIYEEGATTVVPPGAVGEVAPGGQLLIDVSGMASA